MRHFLIPMRNSGRNRNNVALAEVMNGTALDIRSQPLAWLTELAAHHLSARDERGITLDNVKDVRLFFVHLNVASLGAMGSQNQEVFRSDDGPTLGQCGFHFFVSYIGDIGRSSRFADHQHGRGEKCTHTKNELHLHGFISLSALPCFRQARH